MPLPAERQQSDDRERTERSWLAALRTGDPAAFEAIFRAYAAPLCDFAHSYVQQHETAEEIVQELFCWMWEQRFTIDAAHGLRGWLFTAVRNRSLNALRDSRTELSIHDHLARAPHATRSAPSADAELSASDLAAEAARAVAAMPPRCREAYTLIRQQQLSYAEAAQVMGISSKTVEIHMTRATALLRAALAPWLAP